MRCQLATLRFARLATSVGIVAVLFATRWGETLVCSAPLCEERLDSRQLRIQTSTDLWDLERDGFTFLRLPLVDAAATVLTAGAEMAALARSWRPIKNGDQNKDRRQAYLRMRGMTAPMSVTTASVLEAAEHAVATELPTANMRLNDVVAIADFSPHMTRQELHRDIRRDAVSCATHGVFVPLAHGARLHAVPGSHSPRSNLRGSFSGNEVRVLDVAPGWALLWDGMLVHAGDGATAVTEQGRPTRLRLHAYAEPESEQRPFDDPGDRSILETD